MSTTALAPASNATAAFMPVMGIEMAIARRNALVSFVKDLMVEGEDYGVIPGSKKPTLLKPGAEKLSSFFGLEPEMQQIEEIADWTGKQMGEPFYYIRYRCTLLRDGRRLGVGEGSGSTWESKHRYRWLPEEDIPFGIDKTKVASKDGMRQYTEFEFAIEKSETAGKYGKPAEYWQAFKEAIGAGTAKVGEREIKGKNGPEKKRTWTITIGSRLYRCPNPDFADLVNTIQKMAQKRAFIASILIATGASQFFTQDLEDLPTTAPPPDDHGEHAPTKETTTKEAEAARREVEASKLEELRQKQKAADERMVQELEAARAQLQDDSFYLAVLGRAGLTDTQDLLSVPAENRRKTGVGIYREISAEVVRREQEARKRAEAEEDRENWLPDELRKGNN